MNKYVYIVHGWGDLADKGFQSWLKKELEKRGYVVCSPQLPNTNIPKIDEWVSFLGDCIVSKPEDTILLGHSLGVATIMRYLETVPEGYRFLKFISVAGVVREITGLSDADTEIGKPWLEDNIDYEKVRQSVEQTIAFFSDNDPYIPLSSGDILEERLGTQIIIEHNKGHYNKAAGIFEVPSVLDEIIK